MKPLLFLVIAVFASISQLCFAQQTKAIEKGIFRGDKKISNGTFYYLKGDSAIYLAQTADTVYIDTSLLTKTKTRFLVIYKNRRIAFTVPRDFYYFKIYPFRPGAVYEYRISLGLDEDYIVTASKRKFKLINEPH